MTYNHDLFTEILRWVIWGVIMLALVFLAWRHWKWVDRRAARREDEYARANAMLHGPEEYCQPSHVRVVDDGGA